MPDELREELADHLLYTRKWNGMCVHIFIGADGEPRIYTSAMDEKTDSFPWQVEELKSLDLYPSTWYMAEAVHIIDGLDCPDRMKTVFGLLTEKAIEWQEKNGKVRFKIFNELFSDGVPQEGTPYEYRFKSILETFGGDEEFDRSLWEEYGKPAGEPYSPSPKYFDAIVCGAADYDDALQKLKANPEWEGFVIWNTKETRIPIKWGGAPSRKGGAWKLKNFKEGDVLIIDWETGKGKLNDDVATLQYGAYDAGGNIVLLGRGGSGLDGTLRAEIKQATLPIVAEVKYEEITKAGKFRLPVILRTRSDKAAIECTLESLTSN